MMQNIRVPNLSLADGIRGLLLAILVIVGTFPENDWSYSTGIDPPLFWVFNHLFETGLNLGRHIIFPHGPLAFFMYPLSENILLATLVTSLLKGLLVFNVALLLNESKNQTKWLAVFAFAYLISLVANFNQLLLANLILLYCNYYQRNYKPFKYLAFLLTAFAFFVKAYVAIVAGTLFFSFVIYFFIQQKNIKSTLIDAISLLGFILLFWLLMFGTLRGFTNYIWGMAHLAQDNSSAAAYYPQNNWWVLILFMLTLVSVFLIEKTKKSYFYAALIALSLFASWKHGMAREDIFHTKGFLVYLIICLFTFILFSRKKYAAKLILTIVTLLLFSINMKNAANYFPYKYEFLSVNNFVEFITHFDDLKQKSIQESERKTTENRLPKSILDKIGDSKVDIYPWDYSIAGINKLNWQPRVIIQSYAAYTSWLDKQNALHFSSKLAPEYLIWENNKTTLDVNGSVFNSLDSRYLLNDEPQTILQLISNYNLCLSQGKFKLYQKREEAIPLKINSVKSIESTWGEWIPVPDFNLELLRSKLDFNKNIKQRIKSFLYKDEQFWMYLKLKNGSINKYRIVPKNAADGLWINPYIFNKEKVYTVDKIMFKASNQSMLNTKLKVEWEEVGFKNSPDQISNFFDACNNCSDTLLFASNNNFEQTETPHWHNLSVERLSEVSFAGQKSHTLKENPFSATFSYSLDSIPFGKLRITADAWVKSPDYKQQNTISLVIVINDENGQLLYKSTSIDEQLIDRKQWNNIFKSIEVNHQNPDCKLGVYIWSTNNEEVFIDDFRVMIFADDTPAN